jgi:hypothetical protein
MSRPENSSAGSATVEQTGVVLLIALAMAALVVLYLTGSREPPGRELGQRIANRIACGPRALETCGRHPAVSAYGWPLARFARYLVDFRYCQRPSCAVPQPGERGSRLTTANRRTTAFTEVSDRRRSTGAIDITYWLYRPGLGWEELRKRAGPGDLEAASGTRVLLKDSPRLVPLEILPGRNHYRLPPGEEPPWRWRVEGLHNGRSS